MCLVFAMDSGCLFILWLGGCLVCNCALRCARLLLIGLVWLICCCLVVLFNHDFGCCVVIVVFGGRVC